MSNQYKSIKLDISDYHVNKETYIVALHDFLQPATLHIYAKYECFEPTEKSTHTVKDFRSYLFIIWSHTIKTQRLWQNIWFKYGLIGWMLFHWNMVFHKPWVHWWFYKVDKIQTLVKEKFHLVHMPWCTLAVLKPWNKRAYHKFI